MFAKSFILLLLVCTTIRYILSINCSSYLISGKSFIVIENSYISPVGSLNDLRSSSVTLSLSITVLSVDITFTTI